MAYHGRFGAGKGRRAPSRALTVAIGHWPSPGPLQQERPARRAYLGLQVRPAGTRVSAAGHDSRLGSAMVALAP